MDIKPYKQTTFETCLAVCLMLMAGIKPTYKREVQICKMGRGFNFAKGQLNYLARNLGKDLAVFVDNKTYFRKFKRDLHKKIVAQNEKIDLRMLKSKLINGPVIIYLDSYYLHKEIHYPHFVLSFDSHRNRIQIMDPWIGKIKWIPEQKIKKGIISLRNHLRFCPLAITNV